MPGVTRLPLNFAEVIVESLGVPIANCSPNTTPKKVSVEAGAEVNVIFVPETVYVVTGS